VSATPPAISPRAAVATAIRRVLDRESKRNELRVGTVRVCGYGAVCLLDVVTGVLGLRPLENILQTLVFTVLSLGVYAALVKAPFQSWYKYALPLMDGLMLTAILTNRLQHLGAGVGLTATTALICAVYAITGSLRFERASALWTTVLAAVLLIVLLGPRAVPHELAYSLIALAAIGLLAMWLADLVRRSMEGSSSRIVLQRFLPRELVESAFDDPLAMFGEPRVHDATVLVSDLRGFTAIAERMAPSDVFAFLSELQGELARIVHAHGGGVDKFMGDGMLAVFGAAGDPEGHAARAVSSAIAIRKAIEKLNARNRLPEPVRIGIGVHSGSLVAGCLGSGDRLEWTVIGDTVNTASRVESMTKELGVDVLITSEVVRRAGDVGAVLVGPAQVRGREQGIDVYTLPA
jgi:class 3 adenylate cyclase